jgi:hypothetical protein
VSSTAGDGDGSKGWRDFFASVGDRECEGDDESVVSSLRYSATYNSRVVMGPPRSDDGYDDTCSDVFSLSLANPAPSHRSGSTTNRRSTAQSNRLSMGSAPPLGGGDDFAEEFVFKISDSSNHIHRIKCAIDNIDLLRSQIAEKVITDGVIGANTGDRVVLKYVDDDQDDVILTDNASLTEAVDVARAQSLNSLKLSVTVSPLPPAAPSIPTATKGSTNLSALSKPSASANNAEKPTEGGGSTMLILGLVGLLAIGGAAAFAIMRSKK